MEKKKRLILDAGCLLIILAVLYLFVRYLLPVIMPFVVAFIFAYMIHSISSWTAKYVKLPQKILTIGITALFFGVMGLAIVFLGSYVVSSAADLVAKLPDLYKDEVLPWLNQLLEDINERYQFMNQPFFEFLENSFAQWSREIGNSISQLSVSMVRTLSGFAAGIPSLVIRIVVTIVATFFAASDFDKITGFCLRMLPEKGQQMCRTVTAKTKEVIIVYLKSYLFLMMLTFLELCLGLWILRIPYFPIIALGIAIFDILPVLGTGGILIPWSVIALILGNYRIAVGVLILYLCITIVRNMVEPRIVGRQIGLHPLATLISLFVGFKLMGRVGMIGIPVLLSLLVNLEKEGVIHWFPREDQDRSGK